MYAGGKNEGIFLNPKLYSKVLLEFLMHMTFDCFSLTLSNQLCGMRACKFFRTMLCRQLDTQIEAAALKLRDGFAQ